MRCDCYPTLGTLSWYPSCVHSVGDVVMVSFMSPFCWCHCIRHVSILLVFRHAAALLCQLLRHGDHRRRSLPCMERRHRSRIPWKRKSFIPGNRKLLGPCNIKVFGERGLLRDGPFSTECLNFLPIRSTNG